VRILEVLAKKKLGRHSVYYMKKSGDNESDKSSDKNNNHM
jgi:hypothetical protein